MHLFHHGSMTRRAARPPAPAPAPSFHVACAACAFAPLCLPQDYGAASEVAPARIWKKSLRRGDHLFRRGERTRGLFAVHGGVLKSFVTDGDGHRQVAGFHMPGDLVGLDGLADGVHQCDAIALEDSEVCFVRTDTVARMSAQLPVVQREFQRNIARELATQQRATRELRRGLDADHRVARFLADWSSRARRIGLAPDDFELRMTRDDIGSVLGLSLETVSRSLSRLRRRGLIHVQRRRVAIPDLPALRRLAFEKAPAPH